MQKTLAKQFLKQSAVNVGMMCLIIIPTVAFANTQGRYVGMNQDFAQVMNNLVALPAQLLTLFRFGAMFAGFFMMVAGLIFWSVSGKAAMGAEPRWLRFQKMPSPLGSIGVVVVGALLFLLGDGFFGLAAAMKSISGNEVESMYSLVTYDSTKSQTVMVNEMVLAMVQNVGRFLGFLGMASICTDLYLSSTAGKEVSAAKVAGKFIGSAVIALPLLYNDWVGNTIGFNVMRFIFG